MNIMVFDTETTSLDKPFCYDLGGVLYNTETGEILDTFSFIIQQVWHNLPLFESSYYKEKRELYIKKMRGRTAELTKFGYATQKILRLAQKHEVQAVFAYNSPFDDRVLNFNCDWYKVINPIEHLPLYDIRAAVHSKIAFNPQFQIFCKNHELFTESGNYSTTAENVYKYITNNAEYVEEHTGLEDSLIELQILVNCGIDYNNPPTKVYNSIIREHEQTLTVKHKGVEYEFEFTKRRNKNKGSFITLE